ncbi:MAG: hypothetical protein KJ804_18025 [Proteobacteria bacterium]|nr:hypothetical protein [Pseudomonadota bacterium]MBU1060207.1 hypothetical protein [Pseudomonadota bacterium]
MRKTKLFCWGVMLTFMSLGFPIDGFHGKHIAIAQDLSSQQPDGIANEIDKELRFAEKNMFNGKNEEADKQLEEISAKLDVLKQLDSEHKKITSLESKYERTRKAIDKKLGRTTKGSSQEIRGLAKKPEVKEPQLAGAISSESSGPAEAEKTSSVAELPGGVKKRLKDISGYLNFVERDAEKYARGANHNLQKAAELFDEIGKNYGDQFDPAHPDFVAVKTRFNELSTKIADLGVAKAKAQADAAEAKEAKGKQSAEWVAKFREYLNYTGQEGYNPDKMLFVPGTSEPEKFTEAQKRYEDFKVLYGEYQKTEFLNGKSWELEDLADNQAPLRLKNLEEGFASRVASVSGSAENEIDAAMLQLEKDNGWKSDQTIKPNLLDHNRMTSIREATQRVTTALGESDPKRKEIQTKFDALVAKDKENREIRKERTFMTPDHYTDGDIGELKEKAEALVEKDQIEGGKPLRCTIISDNWQEQTVEEWADTTKTTWRVRTTRSVTGQVAAKTADGVRLITVALAKDKQSDGSWGALYGNLHQYSDPMLEANVKK